jgi:hypothetical protein
MVLKGGEIMKKIILQWDKMEMEDPVFAAGSAHTATASIPVSPAGLACTAELFLSLNGTTKAATSGQIAFTSTGAAQPISLTITMPSPPAGQSYGVYLVIDFGTTQIGAYQGTDSVIIPVVGQPTFTWS